MNLGQGEAGIGVPVQCYTECNKILNDHQNLTYFCTAQNLNHRQACWSLYLSHFDFELIHYPGRHSAKPDALSRWIDHKRGEEDNLNQTLLGPKLFCINSTFCRPTTGAQMIPGEGNIFLEWIQNCINRDKKVVKALKELGTSRMSLILIFYFILFYFYSS